MIDLSIIVKRLLVIFLLIGWGLVVIKLAIILPLKYLWCLCVFNLILLGGIVQKAANTGNTNEGVKNEAPKELVINSFEQDDSLRNFNFRDIGFDKVGTRHAVILGSETPSALSKEERKKNRSESPIISSDLYGGNLPCSKNKDVNDDDENLIPVEIED